MRYLHKLLAIGILVALLASACGSSTDEPENRLEAIEERGSMVCGTSADLPPFEFVDDAGAFTGFDIEFMQEIAERMDVELEIQDMAFDSIIANVQNGNIDCAIAKITATPERDEQVDFSDPYFESSAAVMARIEDNIELQDAHDLANYLVGTQAGNVPTTWITENLIEPGNMPEENLLNYERAEQGVLDLLAGRIEVWVTEEVAAKERLEQEEGLEIVLFTTEWSRPAVILIGEGEAELQNRLNESIEAIIADGTWEELLNKWDIEAPALPME